MNRNIQDVQIYYAKLWDVPSANVNVYKYRLNKIERNKYRMYIHMMCTCGMQAYKYPKALYSHPMLFKHLISKRI